MSRRQCRSLPSALIVTGNSSRDARQLGTLYLRRPRARNTRPLIAERLEDRRLLAYDALGLLGRGLPTDEYIQPLVAELTGRHLDHFHPIELHGDLGHETSAWEQWSRHDRQLLVGPERYLATGQAATGGSDDFSNVVNNSAAASSVNGIPVLSSLPGASATIYLDFDGHFFQPWNVTSPPFDLDGEPTTVNPEEVTFIEDAWRVVSEDYAPFNINVTTVEPPVLADGVSDSEANGVALRLAIGGTSEVLGDYSQGNGGLAFYNSFTNSAPNLEWVFPISNALGAGTISSHEAGHSFGLRHIAGLIDHANRWQPIMDGVVVYPADATWVTGTNDLGNSQDDMAVLSNSLNGFGYRADDHDGTITGATALAGSGTSLSGSGIISTMTDVDTFSVTTTASYSVKKFRSRQRNRSEPRRGLRYPGRDRKCGVHLGPLRLPRR